MDRFVLTLASTTLVVACTADLLPVSRAPADERDAGGLVDRGPTRSSTMETPKHSKRDAAELLPTPSSRDAGAIHPDASEREPAADEDAGGQPTERSAPSEPARPAPSGEAPPAPVVSRPTPIHRYEFSGAGELVLDSIGGAHGEVRGDASLKSGGVRLDGVDDYVELPGRLVSRLRSTTLLLWLHWNGGDCWQRAIDLGAFSFDGLTTQVDSSLFFALTHCPSSTPAAGYVDREGTELTAASGALRAPSTVQAGVVFDADASELRVIVDGRVVARGATRLRLEHLRDDYTLLGRSFFAGDPALDGELLEFRIYDRALDDATLQAIFDAGPDTP